MKVFQATVNDYGYGECTELLLIAEDEQDCWDWLVDSDFRIEDRWDIRQLNDLKYVGKRTKTGVIRTLH